MPACCWQPRPWVIRHVDARFRQIFADGGVAERVVFSGPVPHPELLARYGEMDIALDPFPYSGGLTTLESLWMGVPVITLGGDRFASRHSLSHLTAVGLPEFIVADQDSLSRNSSSPGPRPFASGKPPPGTAGTDENLSTVRCPRFTRNLEEAYRSMWRRWCDGQEG